MQKQNQNEVLLTKHSGKTPLWYTLSAPLSITENNQQKLQITLNLINQILDRILPEEILSLNSVVTSGKHAGKTPLWQAAKLAQKGIFEPFATILIKCGDRKQLVWGATAQKGEDSGKSIVHLLFYAALIAIHLKNDSRTKIAIQLLKDVLSEVSLDNLGIDVPVRMGNSIGETPFGMATKLNNKGYPEILELIIKRTDKFERLPWGISPQVDQKAEEPVNKNLKKLKVHQRQGTPPVPANKKGSKISSPQALKKIQLTTQQDIALDNLLDPILDQLPRLDKVILKADVRSFSELIQVISDWDAYCISLYDLDHSEGQKAAILAHHQFESWFITLLLKSRYKDHEFKSVVLNMIDMRNQLLADEKLNSSFIITNILLNSTIERMIQKHIVREGSSCDATWYKDNFADFTKMAIKKGLNLERKYEFYDYIRNNIAKKITPYISVLEQLKSIYLEAASTEKTIQELKNNLQKIKLCLTQESSRGATSHFNKILQLLPSPHLEDVQDQYDFTTRDWLKTSASDFKDPFAKFKADEPEVKNTSSNSSPSDSGSDSGNELPVKGPSNPTIKSSTIQDKIRLFQDKNEPKKAALQSEKSTSSPAFWATDSVTTNKAMPKDKKPNQDMEQNLVHNIIHQ